MKAKNKTIKTIRSSKEITHSIIEGLEQSLRYAKYGDYNSVRIKIIGLSNTPVYKGTEIKKIRKKVRLTQLLFAKSLGVSVKTVEAWESERNIPQGPAQKILFILDKKPEVINSL